MNDPIATGTPKTRQEAYLLDLIGDVVTLDKQICKLHESVLSLGQALPDLANKEMKRAGDQAILALSGEVGKIAQRIAGDAADTERYYARNKAVGFVGAVVVLTASLFGGGGYLYATSMTASHLNAAERDLVQANVLLQNANKLTDEKIAELQKNSAIEIANIRATSGWAATPTGKLAKKFFDLGDGGYAAQCTGHGNTWKVYTDENNVKRCIPKRRDLFGGDSKEVGWKIP